MIAAINSRRFIEALSWRCLGIMYLHACPWLVKPPSPHSHASEYVVDVSFVVQMLLMLTPFVWTCEMKNLHRCKSSMSHGASFIVNDLCLSLNCRSRNLNLVRK